MTLLPTNQSLRLSRLSAALGLALGMAFATAQANSDLDHLYTTRKGDTIQSVATLMTRDSDWRHLKAYNNLTADSLVQGKNLRIPKGWMKSIEGSGRIKEVNGTVETDGRPAKVGDVLNEKSTLSTGPDGSATIEFIDGALVSLTPKSRVQFSQLRLTPDRESVVSVLRLVTGQLTSLVKKFKPASSSRFVVTTATATAGVRGTSFRVSTDGENASSSEVLEGGVAFAEGEKVAGGVLLNPGFGSVAEKGKAPLAPVALLAAPQAAGNLQRIESANAPLAWAQVAGARSYRVQVSPDENFSTLLFDGKSSLPALTLPGLKDGGYFVRLRAVDGLGLEGLDGIAKFRIKATPFAPTPLSIEPKISKAPSVALSWPAVPGVQNYRLQIAKTGDFAELLENREVSARAFEFAPKDWGRYYWRIASLETNDRGPFSNTSTIDLVDPPATRPNVVQIHHNATFAWVVPKPGQRATLVVKMVDAALPMLRLENAEPGLQVTMPTGRFDASIELTDPDGKTYPAFDSTRFTVPLAPAQ